MNLGGYFPSKLYSWKRDISKKSFEKLFDYSNLYKQQRNLIHTMYTLKTNIEQTIYDWFNISQSNIIHSITKKNQS